MKLSPNFTLEEFTRSNKATKLKIINTPPSTVVNELARLAQFDEQVRNHLGGAPMTISSGYRCPSLNKAVGGVANSDHLSGRANDFIAPKFGTPFAICKKLKETNLPFDQLIYERSGTAVWVHISISEVGKTPRRQVLTIDSQGTRIGLWN